MKRIALSALICLAFIRESDAGEITLKVSDADQAAFGNLPGAVDACVAGLQLRGDAAMCKAIAAFANEFGAKVKAAAPEKPTSLEGNPDKGYGGPVPAGK